MWEEGRGSERINNSESDGGSEGKGNTGRGDEDGREGGTNWAEVNVKSEIGQIRPWQQIYIQKTKQYSGERRPNLIREISQVCEKAM